MDVKGVIQGIQAGIDNYGKVQEVTPVENETKHDEKKADEISEKQVKKEDEISEKQVKKAVGKLNKFLEDENTHAEYSVHEKFGDIMIKIVDNETKQVIMEVPPKKVLDLVAKLCELGGVIFDRKA